MEQEQTGQGRTALWIGVTTRSADAAWVARWTVNYLRRLEEFGAMPVILAPDAPAVLPSGEAFAPDAAGHLPHAVLDQLDGIIFSGGGDVHPRHFSQPLAGAEEESIDEARDALELALGAAALARDLPIFGICRGCQVLNVVAGGGMVQHVDGHRSDTAAPRLHAVVVQPGSQLSASMGAGTLPVNTYHHQTVDLATLAPGFVAAALDGEQTLLVEAYEAPAQRWLVGVQWHPERLQDFAGEAAQRQQRLWQSFIDACAAYRAASAAQGRSAPRAS